VDFKAWAATWLKTAGCNEIWHEIEEQDGKITKFTVHQSVWRHGELNRLRHQLYQVALYDEDMKVTRVVNIETSDSKETLEVEELVGQDAAAAYHINYKNFGFGKFRFDDKSLAAFAGNLSKIEDALSRKQVYNIMYDMLKENYISGAQVLDICKSQLVQETAVDVLTDVMRSVIPVVIKNYIPLENYEQSHKEIFELFL